MTKENVDVAIIGVGGMGSAAMLALAQRGAGVCGVEQFAPVHDLGSSHGQTRIIRKAYFEHPDYIPLLHRAYELWTDLEQECAIELMVQTGLLATGLPNSEVIRGLDACYRQHALPHEKLDAGQIKTRFPQFNLADDEVAYYDPIAGYLRVEECVRQQIELAQKHGAKLYAKEKVVTWHATGSGVMLETNRRRIAAGQLIITTGAWAKDELRKLRVKLEIWRKVILWFNSPNIWRYQKGFPIFYIQAADGGYYGFPAIDELGLKIAEHEQATPCPGPEELDRQLHDADETALRGFINRVFPDFEPTRTAWSTCMYAMTPDHHFVLGRHPEHERVFLAAGFSGHGFKFAPVVGETLAELALDGSTWHPIGFLSPDRFFS